MRLEAKALEYEREIRAQVRTNALAQRAQTRLGIGPITPRIPVALSRTEVARLLSFATCQRNIVRDVG
jgi:hypothetical protein